MSETNTPISKVNVGKRSKAQEAEALAETVKSGTDSGAQHVTDKDGSQWLVTKSHNGLTIKTRVL